MEKCFMVHIKVCRGNFFLIISNKEGSLLFTKSCGDLGYKNVAKRSNEALSTLLVLGVKYLLSAKDDIRFFIRTEGVKKTHLTQIRKRLLKPLLKQKCELIGFKIYNKIAHNGCRRLK